MLISYNWLKEYLNLPDSTTAEEVGEKLKASTVEVESVSFQGKGLEQVVVGEILEIKDHPNANKLHIAQVDVGEDKKRQVIFGEMVKMEVGYKVPVALAPTELPGGKKIEKVEMRGELTEGMLCLDQELGLLKEGVNIHFFSKDVKNGTPIIKALVLNDAILEIDNKSLSNRPDLWGHYGLAREVAVLMNKDLSEYKVNEIEKPKKASLNIKVEVEDKKLCPRYMAVAMTAVKVEPSPDWLKQKLAAVGLNSINNIVDVTNYVMMDLGQPMHAFDAGLVGEKGKNKKTIVVRLAKPGEKIKALDNNEYELNEKDLVIADEGKALALAGVIGGVDSAINNATTEIIFESANFEAASIRKTSTRLGVRTDSAQRFEKSLDPNLCATALKKAVELVKQLCPGAEVASKVMDEKNFSLPIGPLVVEKDLFEKKLGVMVSEKEIVRILEKLGFVVKDKKKAWSIGIPIWRATKDISIPEDIVEEVLRVFGYENVPSTLPEFTIASPEANKLRQLERKVSDILVRQFAYTEVYNYSFVSGHQIKNLGDEVQLYIELDNPLAKDRPYLRRNLLPNLLTNIASNIDRNPEVKIFEIGKAFRGDEPGLRVQEKSDELLPRQDTYFTAVYTNKKEQTPYWEMRRIMDTIGKELGLEWESQISDGVSSMVHPTRVIYLLASGKVWGVIGEVHPTAAKNFGLEYRVGFMWLNLSIVQEEGKFGATNYHLVPVYPEVERDLAVVVDKKVNHAEIVSLICNFDPILKKVELFDVFMGGNISEDKKSMAYRLTYGNTDRTLTTAEVDAAQEKVVKILQEKLGAEVRK